MGALQFLAGDVFVAGLHCKHVGCPVAGKINGKYYLIYSSTWMCELCWAAADFMRFTLA